MALIWVLQADWWSTNLYWKDAQLNDRLFANPGRNDHIRDTPSSGFCLIRCRARHDSCDGRPLLNVGQTGKIWIAWEANKHKPNHKPQNTNTLMIHPPLVGIYPLPIWNGSNRGCTWLSFLAAGLVKLRQCRWLCLQQDSASSRITLMQDLDVCSQLAPSVLWPLTFSQISKLRSFSSNFLDQLQGLRSQHFTQLPRHLPQLKLCPLVWDSRSWSSLHLSSSASCRRFLSKEADDDLPTQPQSHRSLLLYRMSAALFETFFSFLFRLPSFPSSAETPKAPGSECERLPSADPDSYGEKWESMSCCWWPLKRHEDFCEFSALLCRWML